MTAFLLRFAGGGEAGGDVTRVGDNCLGGVGGGADRIGIASQGLAASAGSGASECGASVAAAKASRLTRPPAGLQRGGL